MSRRARAGFLSDIQTLGNSYVPIGTIIPIFKADHSKVTDNGVVLQLGSVVAGAGGGSGYTTNLSDPNGFETVPITLEINAGNFSVSSETITYTDHGFITGDKLTVIETSQAPNSTKLGGSIQEIEVTSGGAGYTSSPTISITDSGSGPVKQANVAAIVNTATGVLTGVTVLDGGLGYQFPQITISGGGATTNAVLNIVLATGGEGGVEFDSGFTFYVDKVDDDSFRLARSNGDIVAGKYYNVTDLGSAGNFTLASTTGTGLRVGVSANLDGTLNFCTIKNPGFGYQDGEVVFVNQPGSDGLGRIEIVTTSSPTADDVAFQYPGFLYCDGSSYNADEYPLLYQIIKDDYGGSGGTFKTENFGSDSAITFNVPDYKTRKLVGSGGGVTGGGSPVSGNVIASVGTSGGKWYFSKSEQEKLYDIGNIIISGYTNVTEFVGGSLTGEVTVEIGPLQEKPISTVPEHEHQILTSVAASSTAFEGTGAINDDHSVGFKDSTGQVGFFLPEGGGQLFHNHGIVDYVVTDPNLSTFGNVSGIGEKEYKSFASTAINLATDTITINNHKLFTGNMVRVSENTQGTPASLNDGVTAYSLDVNTTWFVIKVDDNNIKLAKTKYLARTNNSLDITATGDAGNLTFETGYKIAGNLPPDITTTIGTPTPTVYLIDDTYTIGGKTIQLPGNTLTSSEVKVEQGTDGTYSVPAPSADELPIVGITGFACGGGGGGATTDSSGPANGQNSYYQFTFNGNTYRITATGGKGGVNGNNGGAGGAGGAGSYTVNGTTTAFSNTLSNVSLAGGLTLNVDLYYTSNPGESGGPSAGGEGGTSALVNGAGGDGSRTLYTGSGTVSQTFSSPTAAGSYSNYNIPNTWPLDSLTAEVRGGGGGAGHDGNETATPGSGTAGKRVTALVNQTNSGTLRIYVGGGGSGGNGTTRGTGSSNGFASGGNGGNGSGAGGGGGGGAASAVGTSSTNFIGAAGGGGGGGGGNTGGTSGINGTTNAANDGVQELSAIFGNGGGTGSNSVCSGGGGGGGGGGVGVGAGIGGGGGGGNGSNARRSGYGGQRGQSSIKSSGTGPTATLVSSGGAGNAGIGAANSVNNGGNGSVTFTAVENQTYYGDGGGGGGSGAFFYWSFTGMENVGSGTAVVGGGNNNGGQDGAIQVGYLVTSSTDGGTATSSTSGLFDSSSDGVDYAPSGTGTGTAGFNSPNDEQYLRFEGSEQVRYARTIAINASDGNSKGSPIIQIVINVITGNGSNGGETPNEPLELFASNDNAASFAKIGTVSSAGSNTSWTDVTLNLDSDYQVSNLILELRQTRASSGNASNDNYGVHQVKFIYDETEQQIVTYPTAKADLGIEKIVERIEPQGDPLNSAGIDVNEGLFTLSSAVKLNVTSALQPEIDIPLLTRYHRVKYLIRAY